MSRTQCIIASAILMTLVGNVIGQPAETALETQRVEINHNFNVTFVFRPSRIEGLIEQDTRDVVFNVWKDDSSLLTNQDFILMVGVRSSDPVIAEIPNDSRIIRISPSPRDSESAQNYSFPVKGLFLGRTQLHFAVASGDLGTQDGLDLETWNASGLDFYQWEDAEVTFNVAVIRKERVVDLVFIGVVSIVVFFSKIGMGCKIDVDVVRDVVRRPVPLFIGFICQFTIMPTVAFALSKAVGLHGGQALGFFASGCAPGGGASNMYTYLLHGDVSLSITMTLVSVTASLGMIPLWLLTLGQKILQDGDAVSGVEIPFLNILLSLLSFLCPIGIGIVIQKKRPGLAKMILRVLRPFFITFIALMFAFGFYSNLYLFKLFTPQLVLAGMLLPYTGFVLGGFCATIFRQPRARIIAISIETGIQNTGIPLLLMKYSLPQPEADLSVIAPIIIVLFTPIPLWVAILITEIRNRFCKKATAELDKEGRSTMDSETEDVVVFSKGEETRSNEFEEESKDGELLTSL